jgi:hypothetical protein
MLEDIFLEMDRKGFTYPPVSERWMDYTEKKPDA